MDHRDSEFLKECLKDTQFKDKLNNEKIVDFFFYTFAKTVKPVEVNEVQVSVNDVPVKAESKNGESVVERKPKIGIVSKLFSFWNA